MILTEAQNPPDLWLQSEEGKKYSLGWGQEVEIAERTLWSLIRVRRAPAVTQHLSQIYGSSVLLMLVDLLLNITLLEGFCADQRLLGL